MVRGDSHRIQGMKILAEDTSDSRFDKARKSYKRAIDYYKESTMYDESGNPEVYYKLGETYLLMEPPDLVAAQGAFSTGARQIQKVLVSNDLKSEDCTETTSKNITYLNLVEVKYTQTNLRMDQFTNLKTLYSQMHAGMGLVAFLNGVAQGDTSFFGLAMEYFDIGESMAPALKKPAVASLDSLWDLLDLSEVVHPVPIPVMRARLLLYRAKAALDQGMKTLANSYLSMALDNLEQVETIFAKDSRVLAEFTRYYFLKEDFAKCSEYLNRIIDTEVYADKINYKLLKGDIYIKTGKYDSAVSMFTEILDIVPGNSHALVSRSLASANKGDMTSALSDLEAFLTGDSEDPKLFISAGHVYFILKQYISAEQMFLKAYYKQPEDIEINYNLGKLYRVMGKKEQMKRSFERVIRLGNSSVFAEEAKTFIKE
jgi:tetratricopeptide (TPR) repeat protein